MNFTRRSSSMHLHWITYALVLLLTLAAYGFYGLNMVRWINGPDFGWRTMYNSGPNVVAQVFDFARAAGLRVGDRIQAINGRTYTTFEELFFGNVRHEAPGSVNSYTVVREGRPVEVEIPTRRLGVQAVLLRSGALFATGFIYVVIGALVFLMKPRVPESWLFFMMTCLLGVRASFGAPSDVLRPTWLYDLRFFCEVTSSAAGIHLALVFPKRRQFLVRRPWLAVIPYLPAAIIFLLSQVTATAYWNIPAGIFLAYMVFSLVAAVIFLGSMAWNFLRDPSLIVRIQSQVIFAGIMLGFFIPAADLISRFLWNVYVFPDPTIGFVVFLTLFPLSIGYTIVKHDLFAIDVIVRRTYGYVLSTATIVAVYAGVVSLLNVTFRTREATASPLFSIGFALAVVFLFEPLHRRIQRVVDRLFYRQQYDYRKTLKTMSEAMTSILDQDQIFTALLGSVVREMFLENGVLFLRKPQQGGYEVAVAEGLRPEELLGRRFAEDDVLVRAIKERRNALPRHQVEMNPRYESVRASLQQTYQACSAVLMLPMNYKDELLGIVSLGRKKSGKMFTPEDLDLLETIVSQSAIALENARLFKENLQKGRMEEELKIAHDIQMSMLPEKAPRLEGVSVVARTTPAREVGGDFYDFVELATDGVPGALGIVIGDVSGKGVSAGLLMAAARSTYRVLLDANPSVRDVMTLANHRLRRDIRKGMFVALLYAVLDRGGKTLTLSNAGQTQPILCASGAAPCYIGTAGDTFPLGIVPDCDYQETRLNLSHGDIVVFYTDGVVEAMNASRELYGFDRLLSAVRDAHDLEAPALLDTLFDDVARFAHGTEQHDDITIIVARVE